MQLQGLGTRRKPCTSRLMTNAVALCLDAGDLAVCWGSGGGHYREDCVTCSWGEYLCLESLHSDAYVHLFAMTDPVKDLPCFPWCSWHFFWSSQELLLFLCLQLCVFSICTRKTMRFFFEWTWNTEMWRSLQQTKWTTTKLIVRSQQSFLVVTVSDCCCSTFPTFLPTVCFMSLLLVERCRVVGPLGSDPRGSRGTVKWWLGSPSRYGGKCRVHQGGRWEQLVPTNYCAW